MVFYELFCISRPFVRKMVYTEATDIAKNLAKRCGTILLDRRGAIDGFEVYGLKELDKPIKKQGEKYDFGFWWGMRFHCSTFAQYEMFKTLHQDPSVLRFNIIRKAYKIDQL
ncbi:ribosomal protein subunit Mrp17 [Schizosaccharomyces japonicus yFS275]|uniref:Ribosomal protein subunit Mrp17 n=1 Tax=Schizosaccharomyces japonicus (strain yFS275 / FY16936) TaxID=402676 RepID=B6JY08_SCHJY|nr:ribosomal protein subunit Mrp17 [Schizosaccharomyces japonicus yFS275]EEB06426.1 ribosomal protein subunit Mrp17 [Schizosaccharomyces japonicus yFS275]